MRARADLDPLVFDYRLPRIMRMLPLTRSEPASPIPELHEPNDRDEALARLDPETVRRLSQLRPALSSAHIALEWTLIVVAAISGWMLLSPWLYPFLVAFIGARQHALMILAHEAAHYRLFRNRALNDWLGELLLAWPFVLLSMQAYRRNHFPHHRYLNTDKDPDWTRKQTAEWTFPKSRADMARMLVSDALGLGFVRFVLVALRLPPSTSESKPRAQRAFKLARLGFLASTIAVLTTLELWLPYLIFWLLPFLTWTQLVFHVRSIAEHFAIEGRGGTFAHTRTVLTNWFDELFVLSKGVNYHLEHHLYPSVPFYNLPELHRILMGRPDYAQAAHVTHGYLNVLRETCGQARRRARSLKLEST
jgi:fatty acid desaturase